VVAVAVTVAVAVAVSVVVITVSETRESAEKTTVADLRTVTKTWTRPTTAKPCHSTKKHD